MNDVKVSVCMVTYNHEQYIAQAVESALAQRTTFPVEIVIGEDCSTDNTRALLVELARQNPDRIRLRLAETNQGAPRNFIGTFGDCRGQYIVILEGDDYFLNPDKLQIQADKLDARPDWAICFHPVRCIYEDGLRGPEIWPENWRREVSTIYDLLEDNFIPTSAAMFRNRLFPALPAWFGHSALGDWPLNILNAAHGNIGYLPEPMSAYRKHARGIWSGMDRARQLTLTFQMFAAIDHHFNGKYTDEIYKHRQNTLHWLVDEANQAKSLTQRIEALEEAYNRLSVAHAALQTMAAEHDDLKAVVEEQLVMKAQLEQQLNLKAHVRTPLQVLRYKAVREARRFGGQLQRLVRQFSNRPPKTPPPRPPAPPRSRAA